MVSTVGLVAEIGDMARFDHPRKLMSYLELAPRNAPVASA
ncbi:hypothetical protein THIX_50096 [Thiomonas sp. X19]|nr:hypothetical protein THIX_50096 [Thiomonas sp. X19]